MSSQVNVLYKVRKKRLQNAGFLRCVFFESEQSDERLWCHPSPPPGALDVQGTSDHFFDTTGSVWTILIRLPQGTKFSSRSFTFSDPMCVPDPLRHIGSEKVKERELNLVPSGSPIRIVHTLPFVSKE